MEALGRLPSAYGIAAMQSINVTVLNRWFFSAFFGTALLCVVLAVLALLTWQTPRSVWLLTASVLYLAGVVVTIAFNVPLNDSLAATEPSETGAGELWRHYLQVWTGWNHVRTLAPLLSGVAFMMALR